MLNIIFTNQAKREYASWLKENQHKILNKIDILVEECINNPYTGLGSPEPLKGTLSGKWSRRITKKDRLVYMVDENNLVILQCRGHYSD